MTQHFATKRRTQLPTAQDPNTLIISNYHTAPLGARSVLAAVLPPTHDRNDLSEDPIYFNHPLAREDLQHPLLLHPAASGLQPVAIENYYITGISSSNTQNENSFDVYLYLPNDYDQTTDIVDILTIQLDSMRASGYPASFAGIHAAAVTAISENPPSAELDDDPIDTTNLYTPPQLSNCPYKFRLTLPANSPASAGLLLLAR